MTFLGGVLKRMSWGTQACSGRWSDPALLQKLHHLGDMEERVRVFWGSSPGALFLNEIWEEKTRELSNAGTFIQGRQGAGLHNLASRVRD